MKSALSRAVGMIAILLGGLCQAALAQQVNPLRLQVVGLEAGIFRFRVEGEDGQHCIIQASEDLLNWMRVDALTLAGGTAETDQPTDLPQQFFRALEQAPVSLSPNGVTIFPGDGVFLEVNDTWGTRWIFTVNGITNGNASVGTILPSPLNPARVFFSAPLVGTIAEVTVCATDPDDASRQVCGVIRIARGTAQLQVQPASQLIGLGGQRVFQAGASLPGSALIPLQRVYWKVNGVLGGSEEFGTVNFAGQYRAPKTMPAVLPATIRVGFSLTPEGPVQASAQISLAELALTPAKIVSIQTGPAGVVSATLLKSDGSALPLGPADVTFRAGNPKAASVDANGAVTIGERYGVSVIEAAHNVLGVSDTTVVESRADVHVRVQELKLRTDDEINLMRFNGSTLPAIREIEVTRPGVMFNLIPQFFPFRGRVSLFVNRFANAGGAAVSLVGDATNIISYLEGGRTPQTQGIVASLEERSGFVEIGNKPGTGVITVKYDDGVIQRQASANVTFTRLKLNAVISGSATGKTNEAYISEWIELEVAVSNPSGVSSFIGRTPVRVRFASGQKFLISRPSEVIAQGLQVLPLPEELVETSDITIEAPSGFSTLGFPNPELGRLHLRISPREVGAQKLIVSIPNDPGIPPIELPVQILLPELQIRKGAPPTLVRDRLGYGATTGSVVVANSYIDLAMAKGPSPGSLPLYPDRISGPLFSEQDPLVWRIRKPDGSTWELPADLGVPLIQANARNNFSGHFREPGTHLVSLGLSRRSEIRTADLPIQVVSPASSGTPLADIATASKLPLNSSSSQPIPTSDQLGGIQILAPTSGAWVPNTPIDVLLQTYTGEGLPRRLGKKVITQSRSSLDPNSVTLTTNYVMAGVWCYYVQGPSLTFLDPGIPSIGRFAGASPAIPDSNGLIQFQLLPQPTPDADLVVVFIPTVFTLARGDLASEANLRVETIQMVDGQRVGGTYTEIGITDYTHERDDTFLRQALMLPGRGIGITPRYIPVASQRVRDAVSNGILPSESAHAEFRVVGTDGFLKALGSALPTINLGEGLRLVRQTRNGSSLRVTVETDPAYFTTGRYGTRAIHLSFPDGQTFQSEIQLVAYSLETLAADHNLPQNAAYAFSTLDSFTNSKKGVRFPKAAVPFRIRPVEFSVPLQLFDLELRPSIHACWDANLNGIPDPAEDLNRDGIFDQRDNGSGVPFRGVLPVNPLVGFQRSLDPANGTIQVRQLAIQLFPAATAQFYVFGDHTDHRRLDPQSLQLGAENNPDLVPDFVSRTANGELLLVRLGSNLIDVLPFTAYNSVARPQEQPSTPSLAFDTLRSSRDLTYEAYAAVQDNGSLGTGPSSEYAQAPVAVYVDHEANASDFNRDPSFVGDAVPRSFYAGILDQAFQRHAVGFVDFPDYLPLGRDGRVRPYQPVPGRTATGVGTFGVDLDAVLFDAGYLTAPRKPFIIDQTLNLSFPLRLDELPNSAALLAVPVVRRALGGSSQLSNNQLAPALGGTSGGFHSLNRREPGAFAIESRTPGQAVPGLHAGYLLHDKPANLIDPDLEYQLDDIRDVILEREGEAGQVAGTGLAPESAKLGNYRVHSVMGFAQNEDKKAPIRTAIRSTSLFKIDTDPPLVTPKDRRTFKVKPALLVRESPSQTAPEFNLVVTSQSSGNEKTMKIIADTAVDLAVDVTSTVILAALTEGAYLEACEASIADKVKSAGINLAMGMMESEYAERYGLDQKADGVKFVNQLSNEGFETPIPGISIQGLKDIEVSSGLPASATRTQKFLSPDFKVQQPVKFSSFCDLVDKPISAFKEWVKSTYSAETFGGLGSAQAVGTRSVSICIPKSAQLTNGTYSLFTTLSRAIDVLPEEPSSVELTDLPYQAVLGSYPYADEVSDEELLQRIQAKLNDPDAGQAALRMLRDIGRKSVWRVARSNLYQSYKVRAWRLPGVELMIAPGQNLGNGTIIGDFELTPGETEIPVSTGASAVVSRSNENAGARALVRSGSQEVILLDAVIMTPGVQP
ncbi:MAG: hypothetical protein JNN07_08185 [Verrucomicrobiales bacterium]|nr:hypothetical protein [Verrucomicrobiales bacterium]